MNFLVITINVCTENYDTDVVGTFRSKSEAMSSIDSVLATFTNNYFFREDGDNRMIYELNRGMITTSEKLIKIVKLLTVKSEPVLKETVVVEKSAPPPPPLLAELLEKVPLVE